MKNGRKGIVIVAAVLIVLAAAVALLAYLNRPSEHIEPGTVVIKSGGETLASFTLDELREMDAVEVEKKIVSSGVVSEEGVFRGVPLRKLLAAAGADVESSSQAVIRSEDGFVTTFDMDEVTESDGVFLAYSRDGEGLGTLDGGGTGPLRIIAVDDSFGNRCAKYVSEIEVK